MGKGNSKTKMLIIIACGMLAIVAVLIVIIISVNKKDEPQTDGINTDNTVINTENIITGEADGEKIATTPVSDDKASEQDTPTPTKTVAADSITVTLGQYQGIKVDYSPVIITDSDIDAQLNSLRSEYTDIIDMPDRPFEKGDMVIVTYEGKLEGKLIQELYGVCFQDILGRGMLPDVFENEIIGRKKGDTFSISMDYPEDFKEIPEVAGKTVIFDVSLVDGFIFYTPEIDDAFIKENTEYSSLEEYKTKTKAELQKIQDDIAYEASIMEIKKIVVGNASFEGPIDSEIKKQYVLQINKLNSQFQEEYGIDVAEYYEWFYGIPAEQYTASVMNDVTTETKYNYILQQIAAEKGITTEEADKLVFDSAVIEGMER